jgi:hypothetical protein
VDIHNTRNKNCDVKIIKWAGGIKCSFCMWSELSCYDLKIDCYNYKHYIQPSLQPQSKNLQ